MKTKILAILLTATLAMVASSASAQDAKPQDAKTQALSMSAIGASASFGMFSAHMAINSLGDGWAAKGYSKATTLGLAAGYKGGVGAVSGSLAKIIKEDTTLAEGDKAALNILIDVCTLVSAQADALSAHVNDPSPKNAADYQAKRLAVEKKLFGFMGIEEGDLPKIGDAIGKEKQ